MIKDVDPAKMIDEFSRWLRGSSPSIMYWVGHLANDRFVKYDQDGNRYKDPPINGPVDSLAHRVYRAYEAGEVHLVQQRIMEDVYCYFAIRRVNVRPQHAEGEALAPVA